MGVDTVTPPAQDHMEHSYNALDYLSSKRKLKEDVLVSEKPTIG